MCSSVHDRHGVKNIVFKYILSSGAKLIILSGGALAGPARTSSSEFL